MRNVSAWLGFSLCAAGLVRAVTKAVTAAVIGILNVNIRLRPLAHGSAEERKIGVQRPRGLCLWWPIVFGIAESAKANHAPFAWHSRRLALAKLRLH